MNYARLGKRLSRQSWNICPRIRALDGYLRATGDRAAPIAEAHPELVFATLGGEGVVAASKKTPGGRQKRLAVLRQSWPQAGAVYEQALDAYPRRRLAPDDVLDAMALAVAAAGPLQATTAGIEYDEMGLPMQILYPVQAGPG